MSKRLQIITLVLIAGLLLTACASNAATTQAPATQAAPADPTPTSAEGYPGPAATVAVQPTTDAGYPAPTDGVPPVTNSGYPAPGSFTVTLADGSVKTLAVEALNALPKAAVAFDGTDLQVLALTDALKQAGVENPTEVTASGAGGASVTLTQDQIAQAYLDILQDGTVRLAVQGQPQSSWVAGLVSLTVK